METFELTEPLISYGSVDDNNTIALIRLIRDGIGFSAFERFADTFQYNLSEWSGFLHISERSMQRYKKDKRAFDPLQSEKIIEIAMLFKMGEVVFGSKEKFNLWLETDCLALGKVKPRSLIDSTFGIGMVKDELGRIDYGILA